MAGDRAHGLALTTEGVHEIDLGQKHLPQNREGLDGRRFRPRLHPPGRPSATTPATVVLDP